MSRSDRPFVSFLICTFNRERLLLEAIRSIRAVRGLQAIGFEIVVVDNSDGETARAVITSQQDGAQSPIHYLAAHPANIAVARNAGVQAARGEFIAMLDDDARLEENWYEALENYVHGDFDVILGSVVPAYEDVTLANVSTGRFFSRSTQITQAQEIFPAGPNRTPNITPGTSNTLFRTHACFGDGLVFDVSYGKSGGEDTEMFHQLFRRQKKFLYVPEAISYEHVPADRCAHAYLRKRAYVGGQIYASVFSKNAERPMLFSCRLIATSILQLFVNRARILFRPGSDHTLEEIAISAARGKLNGRHLQSLYG